jgi:hypothetical protein
MDDNTLEAAKFICGSVFGLLAFGGWVYRMMKGKL